MKNKIRENYLIQCILLSSVMAILSFGYFIWRGNGAFTVVADFNVQQLTFASAVRNAVRGDGFGEWLWNLDLGASLITGFSFYNLGSPFFWPSVLLGEGTFPYLAGYLYMIKYVAASITSYLFLKRFVKQRGYAVVGALLYAFSGFQTTNLEFFHFHDVVALFPLLLWGLEIAVEDKKKRGWFIFAIFVNCLVNYFFFIEEVIFLIIYFLFRYWGKSLRELFKDGMMCMFCGMVGVGMAGILFIPSVMYALGSSRSSTTWYLEDFIYKPKEILFILKGILFPGDAMNAQSAIDDTNWDSTSCYLPFFGLSMVLAFCENQKGWLKKIITFLFVISFSPIIQSAFYMFSSVYQRWWHMLVMMLAMATIIVLDSPKEYKITKNAVINVIVVIVFYYIVCNVDWNYYTEPLVFHDGRFKKYFILAVSGPIIVLLLNVFKKFRYEWIVIATAVFCVATTVLTLRYYRVGTDTDEYMHKYRLGMQLESIEDQYRYNCTENELMLTGSANGIGAFCSTVENSSKEFDSLFEHTSPNSTELKDDIPGLTELLGGKYYLTENDKDSNIVKEHKVDDKVYYVAEGEACPIGYAVDYYVLKSDLLDLEKEKRAITLMQAAVIDTDVKKEVADIASPVTGNTVDYNKEIGVYVNETLDKAVSNFEKNSTGFSCSTDYEADKLVYFSVPYSSGWKAYIDNQEKSIISSGGMMLLPVPSGHHEIQFVYHTPGLRMGIVVSIISFLLFAFLCFYERRQYCDAGKGE